jgi:hypothetical protein
MHRDGSACGRPLGSLPTEREAETAPNSASQKPLRAARRLIKAASSTPSQGNGLRQATDCGNRDPQSLGRLLESRIGSVNAWLVVRAAQAGDGSTLSHVSSTAGPRRGGQSKGNGVGHSTHRAKGNQRDQSPTPCWLFVNCDGLEAAVVAYVIQPIGPLVGCTVTFCGREGYTRSASNMSEFVTELAFCRWAPGGFPVTP